MFLRKQLSLPGGLHEIRSPALGRGWVGGEQRER